jgi:hypothetical protein
MQAVVYIGDRLKNLRIRRALTYDFRYNDARDNYVVDAETMVVIQRIFHMVGVEGYTMNAARLAFNREGVRPPSGGRFWSPKYMPPIRILRSWRTKTPSSKR